jgi:hypothetical protein
MDYYCNKIGVTFKNIDPRKHKIQIYGNCIQICGLKKTILECIEKSVREKEPCQSKTT